MRAVGRLIEKLYFIRKFEELLKKEIHVFCFYEWIFQHLSPPSYRTSNLGSNDMSPKSGKIYFLMSLCVSTDGERLGKGLETILSSPRYNSFFKGMFSGL